MPAENSTVAYVAARKEAAILSKLGGKHHIVPVLELMDLPELDSYVLIMPYIASDPAAIRTSAVRIRRLHIDLLTRRRQQPGSACASYSKHCSLYTHRVTYTLT